MSESKKYATEAEDKAYWDGWRAAGLGIAETEQVRKIACALIRAGETRYPIPETAWEIWRAIKAGQEAGK